MEQEKVGELTQAQLMAGLSSLLDLKLSKLATKEDLINLSKKVETLETENKLLREELASIKRQERLVLDKVVDLESRSRRNNLIFKGMKVPQNTTDFCQIVRKFCTDVLGSRDTLWVNRAHPLGRDKTTLIAHIPEDAEINFIMSRVRRLKDTGYTVHRDFPQEIREKRAKLVKVRTEVERVAGRRKMPLIHDHLVVEGCRFTWDDGKLWGGPRDGGVRLKELLDRDFSEFLAKLQKGDEDHRGHQRTTAAPPTEATAGGGGDSTSTRQ